VPRPFFKGAEASSFRALFRVGNEKLDRRISRVRVLLASGKAPEHGKSSPGPTRRASTKKLKKRLTRKTALAVFSSDALCSTDFATGEMPLVLMALSMCQAYVF